MSGTRSYPTPDELLPHSGRMNLLEEVREHTAEHTTCRFVLTREHVFYRNGCIPAWFGVEFLGQCAFYHFQLNRHLQEKPGKQGLFLGGRRISFATSEFELDRPYIVYAEDFGTNDRFFAAAGYICPADEKQEKLVQGRLNALLLDRDNSLLSARMERFSTD